MADNPRDRRSTELLKVLLPKGVMGVSMALAAADAAAATTAPPSEAKSVASRLEALRGSVSDVMREAYEKQNPHVEVDPEQKLAWWGNGWHNGGWRNGGWGNGWHNGGWGNGWHNGGWGNGWPNGWGNWHNGGLLGALLSPLTGSWGNHFRNW